MADRTYRDLTGVPRTGTVAGLVRREAIAALIGVVAVCAMSALVDAPIAGPADERGLPLEKVKAPWIFVGIQQGLRYLPPLLAGVVAPLGLLIVLAVLSAFPRESRRIRGILFFSTVFITVAFTLWGYFS